MIRFQISGNPVLIENMKRIRDNVQLFFGERFNKIMPDYIESIKKESRRLGCPPARATMHIIGVIRINIRNSEQLCSIYIAALTEGLERGLLDG